MTLVEAKNYLDPEGSIVVSAALLADVVLGKLNAGEDVTISLLGLRGLPSSYFNTILLPLVEAVGIAAVRQRVRFQIESEVQRQVFQRSLDAVAKSVA
jgi:hypothetical protein